MKLHKPIYADIRIDSLMDHEGNLFQGLFDGFPTHISIDRTLENLFTWDQIDQMQQSNSFKFLSSELQIAVNDYLDSI